MPARGRWESLELLDGKGLVRKITLPGVCQTQGAPGFAPRFVCCDSEGSNVRIRERPRGRQQLLASHLQMAEFNPDEMTAKRNVTRAGRDALQLLSKWVCPVHPVSGRREGHSVHPMGKLSICPCPTVPGSVRPLPWQGQWCFGTVRKSSFSTPKPGPGSSPRANMGVQPDFTQLLSGLVHRDHAAAFSFLHRALMREMKDQIAKLTVGGPPRPQRQRALPEDQHCHEHSERSPQQPAAPALFHKNNKCYLQSCFPNILPDQLNCFSPWPFIVSVPAAITQASLSQILMCTLFKYRVPMSRPGPCAAGGTPRRLARAGVLPGHSSQLGTAGWILTLSKY